MKIGYVSGWIKKSARAELRSQLKEAGCAKIFEDPDLPAHGQQTPALCRALAEVTTGDVLFVSAIDCLGYGLPEIAFVLKRLERVAAFVQTLDHVPDHPVHTPACFLAIIRAVARLQGRCVSAGLATVVAETGRRLGAPPKLTAEQIEAAREELEDGDVTQKELAARFGVCESTMSRALKGRAQLDPLDPFDDRAYEAITFGSSPGPSRRMSGGADAP